MTRITQDRLRYLFDYSPVTGLLYTRQPRGPWGKVAIGDPLVCNRLFHKNGKPKYAQLEIDGEKWYHHRAIWFWVTGYLPVNVDHENRDICCNAWHNLREATISENAWNREKQSNNTSGYKGVYFDKSKGAFRSKITAGGKILYLGIFSTAEEAAKAYSKAAKDKHLGFARDDTGKLSSS